LTFREIAFGSDEYRLELSLRDAVLRRPLGLSLDAEDLGGEESQTHFGLFDEETGLAACAIAVRLSASEARIRQMAVLPAHQGRGMGRRLLSEVERRLRRSGFARLVLNARASAVGFYEKLGYRVAGDEFVSHTLAHFEMVKEL